MTGTQIGGPPFDDPGDQPLAADERRHAVLHEPVAKADEHVDQVSLDDPRQCRLETRRLQRYQPEVEPAIELGDRCVRLERDHPLHSELVEPEPWIAQQADVLTLGVEHGDAAHVAAHQPGGHAADRTPADHENAGVDHGTACPPSNSTGGSRASSSLSAA